MTDLFTQADGEEFFDFLDGLRASGKTNMWGAGPYLQEEFGLAKKPARDILFAWMHTYSDRHIPERVAEAIANPKKGAP